MSQDEWLRRLRGAGAAVTAASAASDEAFARFDATIRAARHAGRTVAHLVTVTGLSKARIDEAIAAGNREDMPSSDTDLRVAAYTAAAADADYLARRARRDALTLQAGLTSGLRYGEIAKAAGVSRRYEWQLRTGLLDIGRRSPRQDVFEGAGMEAYRATENARLRSRRQAVEAGLPVQITHGLYGYRHGCRCDVCVEARRGVQAGDVAVSHGLDGYRHGCRCEVCTAKNASYHRDWRRRRSSTVRVLPP
ncbi:hypothetical protein E1258_09480 [Micromonospora sp. KC207]|uniref:hypothetical protein n=1 Tax=Micromonospora sp. KC207 TaxID=2530377 RepID=UPI00104BF636|nr:hypothetical protein [Micromonospora sp. KC207]TDC63867.1 hypothetical protein E1258_09480 [Micromonospora sp. KC207]